MARKATWDAALVIPVVSTGAIPFLAWEITIQPIIQPALSKTVLWARHGKITISDVFHCLGD